MTLLKLNQGLMVDNFIIPTNGSFLLNNDNMLNMQKHIMLFKKFNSNLTLSFSVDGKIVDADSRAERDDEFYDKMFAFAKLNNFHFHPMVSAGAIEKWIDNYQWWENECTKRDINLEANVKLLEVRDDEWTEEKIDSLCEFITYRINNCVNKYSDGRTDLFTKQLFGLDGEKSPWSDYLTFDFNEKDNFASCNISKALTIRVGDLSIVPCHRLGYNRYKYANFIIENDKIVDIDEINLMTALRILMTNNTLGSIRCDICKIKNYCIKGCFGAQYEATGDPFITADSTCDMMIKKTRKILSVFRELGVFDVLKEYKDYPRIKKFLTFVEDLEYGE